MILEDAEVIFRSCCGLDVHKKTIKACIRKITEDGKLWKEIRTFGTMSRDIRALSAWMQEHNVTHVAMESTGVYWKPIWNLLEGDFQLLLVNAQHLKKVPGRKSDVRDCEWIAKCLQMGMLKPSFVPNEVLRQLRDMTRHRSRLIDHHTAIINRIHKTLEDCNIKLSSVATDITGVSAMQMIAALSNGQSDQKQLANLAKGRMRSKLDQLEAALEGRVTGHHRFMLALLLRELDSMHAFIEEISQQIDKMMAPFEQMIQLFTTTTAVGRRTAQSMVAECGVDMNQYPSVKNFTSWISVCPGSNESGGKHKSGKSPQGNKWAKRALTEAAWAASRTKESYFYAQYHRIAGRRGSKRAIGAVRHSLAVCYYFIVKNKVPFKDLGADYFKRLNPVRLKNYYIRKLEHLGFKVSLEDVA